MDRINRKLMAALMQNSRAPITQLAKKIGVSREVATYRLNKLISEKVILDFVAEINTEKLGYVGAAVFVNVKATRQKEFMNFLNSCDFVSWVAHLSGLWSFGFSIYGKTNEELDEKFLTIYEGFKDDIIGHRFILHRKSLFFYEKYFQVQSQIGKRKSLIDYKIDEKNKIILKELSKNSRIDSVTLAKRVSLTAPAVAHRIKQLKLSGYIDKYSIFVDVSKLSLYQYSIFVVNKNIDENKKFIAHLINHPNVSYTAEYVGDPFLEFGLFISDPYDLRKILQVIEEKFPSNRVIEISLFQKELISVGPPACVFE